MGPIEEGCRWDAVRSGYTIEGMPHASACEIVGNPLHRATWPVQPALYRYAECVPKRTRPRTSQALFAQLLAPDEVLTAPPSQGGSAGSNPVGATLDLLRSSGASDVTR